MQPPNERGAAPIYVGEMRRLLPVLQARVAALGAPIPAAHRAAAARDLRQLARMAADLSANFHVEDCALLAAALGRAFPDDLATPPGAAAAAADVLRFLTERVARITEQGHLLAPSDRDRTTAGRLLAALSGATRRDLAVPVADDPPGASRGVPTPARGAGPPHWAPPSRAPASAPGVAGRMAQPGHPSNPWLGAPLGAAGAPAGAWPVPDRAPGPPPPGPAAPGLSAEDLAIIQAFKAGPLRSPPPAAAAAGARPMIPSAALAAAPRAADLDAITGDMRAMFVAETTDDLRELQRLLVAFEQRPADRDPVASMVMLAHKIKGTAGTMGFAVLGALAHAYEDHLGALQAGRIPADAPTITVLLQGLGELDRTLASVAIERAEDPEAVARMHALTATLLARAADRAGAPAPAEAAPPGGDPSDSAPPIGGVRPAADPVLRVDVRHMDDLMRHVGALAANRVEAGQARGRAAEAEADMAHAIGRLDELTARLAEYGSPAPGAPPSPADAAAEAGPEGARREGYDQIRRALAEAVDDARTSAAAVRAVLRRLESLERAQEALAVTIEQTVIQVRLVPLSDHVPLLQHTAHVLAGQGGKQVEFAVSGAMTGIDREVSEPLVDALTQLVRNAVTHGIEPPDERLALGKPATGRVWLRGEHAGNEVEIEVGDDGRGINPDQVIASALVAGAIDPAAARRLDPRAALDLIFEQGVSTVDEPSAAAGTGVGMAAVADTVQRLRGSIAVHSVPGRGTAFRLRVPISLGILRALRVRADGQEYALPAAAVLHTQPLDGPAEPAGPAPTAGRRLRATVRGEEVALPLHSLSELLGRGGLGGHGAVALVVETRRARLALAVDEVLAEGDVVVRALPAYLRRRLVRGAALSAGREVLLLLDVPALVALAGTAEDPAARRRPVAPRLVPAPNPAILVVDDSLTIRHALEGALTRAGFAVRLARDGMEALELMLAELPEAVILDIEMPRLDGFALLGRMRAHDQLARVPVAMLTTRAAEKHRRQAEALGADAYLVKPCPDDELVATVRKLLARP